MKRPVLLEKCRRLRRTLEAATVPIENGRCLRDGFDAQTLSEAVDEMYSAACCIYEMLLANATRMARFVLRGRREIAAASDG